jgi:hypothetical protein
MIALNVSQYDRDHGKNQEEKTPNWFLRAVGLIAVLAAAALIVG